MTYGCCLFTLIPCRAEASDKSEQVNQLLFGECYEVLEITPKWLRIKTRSDKYVAWIDSKLHSPLTANEILTFESIEKTTIQEPVVRLENTTLNTSIILTFGCVIPANNTSSWTLGTNSFRFPTTTSLKQFNTINELAKEFLGAPYLWGGKSLFGIDCSGFVQVIYRAFNINLPRDAYQQVEMGTKIDFPNQHVGDLAYFSNDVGRVTHVGICLADDKIIHCAGRCRIDQLTDAGIFNPELQDYTHQLHSIKRI